MGKVMLTHTGCVAAGEGGHLVGHKIDGGRYRERRGTRRGPYRCATTAVGLSYGDYRGRLGSGSTCQYYQSTDETTH